MNKSKSNTNNFARIMGVAIIFITIILAVISNTTLNVILDLYSFLVVTLIPIAVQVFSNHWRDYTNGCLYIFGKKELSVKAMKLTINAFELSIKTTYLAGILGSIIGMITLLGRLDDPSSIGPSLAVAVLTIFYALWINVIQNGMKYSIKKDLLLENE